MTPRFWRVHSHTLQHGFVQFTCRARARGFLMVCRATDPDARIEYGVKE